mgnify:CR=1 FL=1
MSAQAVSDALTKIDGKGRKVEFLKGQIKIRTVGLGWTDLKVAWSKGGVNKEPEELERDLGEILEEENCLLYTSPSPRDKRQSRMPSSA